MIMSLIVSDEPKIEEIITAARQQTTKCKIPLISTSGNQRTKPMNNIENTIVTNSRPRLTNRTRDQGMVPGRTLHTIPMLRIRPEREKLLPALKRPSTIPKRVTNENKSGRSVITVPVPQRNSSKSNPLRFLGLPTQNNIMKQEELEIQQNQTDGCLYEDLNEQESITSESHKITKLKTVWQEKMVTFEKSKKELEDRQNQVMELYASLRNTHRKMKLLGQKVNLPSAEELHIMNVAKLSPEQLLQLCAGGEPKALEHSTLDNKVTFDVNKLLNIPNSLVDKCEETLFKRKEIINWFESLMSQEKGISTKTLTMKIKEFNAENDLLKSSLDQLRTEFLKEINDIIDCLRKNANETMALQLRTKELSCALSDLNTQNAEMRKQIHSGDHHRPYANRNKIEELEKELKEEKYKKSIMKDRLSRAEHQLKTNVERVVQLEAALEQARSESWSLERTVQQQHQQNQKLQEDFDQELNKLTQSIKDNTTHLEDIALAREKLQSEKEEVEKRLEELSASYNKSIKDMKHEMNLNIAKLIEIEKKYNDSIEEKKTLQENIDDLRTDLLESELRVKDLVRELDEKESILETKQCVQKELESTKTDLEHRKTEIEEYKRLLFEKGEEIDELKSKLSTEKAIKDILEKKDELLAEQKEKQQELKEKLKERESQMKSYYEELMNLKNQITQLREFGAFDNLNDVGNMINQQRDKLFELTKRQEEYDEKLQTKENEIKRLVESMTEQEHVLNKKEKEIKMLNEKEEEHMNIINLLHNKLELRNEADIDHRHQLIEKSAEINTLINSVESRKNHIIELENIILAQEEQIRKASLRRKKDQEKINMFEKRIAELESRQTEMNFNNQETPENLDNLIKILEDELDTPFGTNVEVNSKLGVNHFTTQSKNYKKNKSNRQTSTDLEKNDFAPVKIVMGSSNKNTRRPNGIEYFKGDHFLLKKAIRSTNNREWIGPNDASVCSTSTTATMNTSLKGLPYSTKENLPINHLTSRPCTDEIRSKMLKFAGHRI
ncbi:putative leucine-rich repeat-containing protein DDB_G0290503 [Bombyx mori]|uniref:Uncharacterized protein n=2 Tax=Bombyx mori TaxID=7091 RepID=A0A8R2HQS7_BOMMO|nr:putative leucine-rich repeat-containing protein DDB_G0290503 isoform X1 [Bombyx mori]